MNVSWITPTLAIGGRLVDSELERLGCDHAVSAVVDLRDDAVDDVEILRRHEIAFLHLPVQDHAAVPPPLLDEGVGFACRHMAQGDRVLVHCEHGIGRSATLVLAILVAQGFAPLQALTLAKDRRERVSPSPAQYDGWRDWLALRREGLGETWEIPTFDAFAGIAYRHLRSPSP